MTLPVLIDVGLGLAVVYFLLATIGSIIVELIAGKYRWRHQELQRTIANLLDEHAAEPADTPSAADQPATPPAVVAPLALQPPPANGQPPAAPAAATAAPTISAAGEPIAPVTPAQPSDPVETPPAKALAPRKSAKPAGKHRSHGRIAQLYRPTFAVRRSAFWQHPIIEPLGTLDKAGPGYLSSDRFSHAVVDLALGQEGATSVPPSRETISALIRRDGSLSPKLQKSLLALLRTVPPDAPDPLAAFRTAVARWYEDAMERTTGAYKRIVQRALFWTGLSTALLLNVDTLRITQILYRDPELRKAAAEFAVEAAKDRAPPASAASPSEKNTSQGTPSPTPTTSAAPSPTPIPSPSPVAPTGTASAGTAVAAPVTAPSSVPSNVPSPTASSVPATVPAPSATGNAATGSPTGQDQKLVPPDPMTTARQELSAELKRMRDLSRIGFPIGWVSPFNLNFVSPPDASSSTVPRTAGNTAPSAAKAKSNAGETKAGAKDAKSKSDEPAAGSGPAPADQPVSPGFWFWVGALFSKAAGLLATAFAVCLGAPFWFDMINKLVKLRSSGGAGEPAKTAEATAPAAGAVSASGTPVPANAMGFSAPVGAAASLAATRPAEPPEFTTALSDPRTEFSAAKALRLAEASRLAYEKPLDGDQQAAGTFAKYAAAVWSSKIWNEADPNNTDTQVYLVQAQGVAVLVFRGTEPTKIKDWRTDADCVLTPADGFPGKVHTGFNTAFAAVYAAIKTQLASLKGSGCVLYVTGHSLGAGLATLTAYRLQQDHVYPVQAVYTYGSPRVGDRNFAAGYFAALGTRTYRVVNNEDIVTRLPPPAPDFDYEHVGEIIYIDDAARLQRDIGFWYRALNFAANATVNVQQALKQTVSDHDMLLYIGQLKKAARNPIA